MKNLILTCSFLLFFLTSFAQKKNDLFFNEFNISMNKTIPPWDDFEHHLGFGLGAYRSVMNQKKVNFLFGFEYNLNREFFDYIYKGHFASATNVQYAIHNWSIPFNLRYNIGKNIKVFIELGGFLDIILRTRSKGIMHTSSPDENNHLVHKEFAFKEKGGGAGPIFGISSGIGIKIPIKTRELIVKSDYKFGMLELNGGETFFSHRNFRISFGINIW